MTIVNVTELSDLAREIIEAERNTVAERVEELRGLAGNLERLLEKTNDELRVSGRLLRQMDEMLQLTPQLPFDTLGEELTGRRLREVAVEVLRGKRDIGEEIHYKEWLRLLTEAGVRVGGKNPTATFLTQIMKSADVESVRPRSGLYRLKVA